MRKTLERLSFSTLNFDQAAHLLGTAHCLLGEAEAAQSLYETAEASSYSLVQLAVLANQAGEAEKSAQLLAEANLNQQKAVELIATFIDEMADLDWRPHLTALAIQYPKNEQIWRLWLSYGVQLSSLNRWNEALVWYQSGVSIQESISQCILCAALDVRVGRIYQTQVDLRDLHQALAYYKSALTSKDELESNEKNQAHLYIGEMYLALPDKYNPEDALAEFERALEIDPRSYWALIDIGRLYMVNLRDFKKAEEYFRAALNVNPASPYTYYIFGDLFQMQGNLVEAEAYYRQALAHQPDYQPAQDRLKDLGAIP